jgi:DNA-binding SARP family transcriptional activator/tetratricopeptide (TPR) repeat protein
MVEAPPVEVLVLGPVRIRQESRLVAPPSLLTRTIIGVLALAGKTGLSVEQLAAAAWPEDRRQAGRSAVTVGVHRARRWVMDVVDDRIRIEHTIGRYTLVGPEVDAHRFLRLAAHDERLAEALALWHGEPLADATAGPQVAPMLEKLKRARLAAATRYGQQKLVAGHASEAVETLLPLADLFPLEEPLHAVLIEVLASAGRQADALDRYERIRMRLAEQLGIDPSRELSSALVRVLRQETISGQEPTVRTVVDRQPAQLPQDVGGFSGRAAQLAELDRLAQPNPGGTVLISALAGIGGVGKTALAVHWAHRVAAVFSDGQLYADLRGFAYSAPATPIEVLGRFLRALGVPADQVPADVEEAAGTYRTLLSGRRVLVLLDNAASADQVRPLLPGSTGCLAVVTSRSRLDGLIAREGARRLDIDVFEPAESMELLRLLLGSERFDAERQAVAELAELCGHLPLALRVACANVLGSPGFTLADRVRSLRADRLTWLAADGDSASSVRAVFGLSYRRLSDRDRRLFRLLALAPGADIGIPAAAQLSGLSEQDTRAAHDRLVAEHLVRAEGDRFSLHDLLREYGRERAEAEDTSGDRADSVARLCRWYLAVVDAASHRLFPGTAPSPVPAGVALPVVPPLDAGSASAVFTEEMANLVAVAVHTAEHGPYETAWLLGYAARPFFWYRGHHLEWGVVTTAASRAAERADSLVGRAVAADSRAMLARCTGRAADAVREFTAGLSAARSAGWASGVASMLNGLGCAISESGNPTRAAAVFGEGIEHARDNGLADAEYKAAGNLAVTHIKTGRPADAAQLLREIADQCARTGRLEDLAHTLMNLGSTYHDLGRLAEARATLREAADLARQEQQQRVETVCWNMLARVAVDTDDHPAVAKLAEDALHGAHTLGDRRQENVATMLLATAERMRGEHERAARSYAKAIDLARANGHAECEAESRLGLAQAWHAMGKPDIAVEQARHALTLCHEGGFEVNESDVLATLASIHLARGHPEWAATQAEKALTMCQRAGTRLREARVWSVLAQVRQAQAREEDSAEARRFAHRLFAESRVLEAVGTQDQVAHLDAAP